MQLVAEALRKDFFRSSGSSNFFTAVYEVNFTLEEGSLVEICGRSGSGKTTLLNMLSGLLTPTSGRVLLGNDDLYAMNDKARSRARNRSIGVIPQGQSALHSLTVRENVVLPIELYGKQADGARVDMLLERVGIAHLANVRPSELSGGEMRRMAIARALAGDAPIIMADEPTGDLDDENTEIVLTLLREIAHAGRAVLLVTHEAEAAKYADAVYRMNAGVLERQ
ncbi:MAG: ABC transporter ATP-binding protein [Clostridia bacterium]|nr:ABC transporter ATP-binding protein [Clostridia bacterium]